MNFLTRFSLQKRLFTLVLFFFLVGAGILALFELEPEAYPDISETEVSIITKVNGLPAEEIETQVTIPVERSLLTVPGVVTRRSRSMYGLSVVKLTFEDKMDLYFARGYVSEKFKDMKLPPGVEPELGPITTSIGEIFRYVIESDMEVVPTRLREIQDYVIIPKLLQTKGVAEVVNFGGVHREYQIILNPLQLEKYNLSIHDIATVIQANNKNSGGNFLVVGASQLNLRSTGRITKPQDIENIVVDNRSGIPVLIKDLGSIEINFQVPTGILGYIDKKRNKEESSGVEGIVLLHKFENPSRVIKELYNNLNELQKKLTALGVRIESFYDRKEFVDLTFSNVFENLFLGSILVLCILIMFFGNFQTAFLCFLSIPFSLLFSFFGLKLIDKPANLLAFGGIGPGIIVISSLIILEQIHRNLSRSEIKDTKELKLIIGKSTDLASNQAIFTTAILILSIFPVLGLERVEGKIFNPFAYTYSFILIGSLIYSLTCVPLLSSYWFRFNKSEYESSSWHNLQNKYKIFLLEKIENSNPILRFGLMLTVLLILAGSFIGTEFMPEIDEGSTWVRITLPAGISLKEARKYPEVVRKEISEFEEVRGVLTQLGRNEDGTDSFGINRIEVLIQLKHPYSSWKIRRTKEELELLFRDKLEKLIPGAVFTITQPIKDTTSENANGASAELAIFLMGDNLLELRIIAEKIQNIVNSVYGSSEVHIEQEDKQTQLVVSIDRNACARYGIDVASINEILETAIGGFPVSSLYEEEKKFDIVMRFTQETRGDPSSIGRILVPSKGGQRIPLSQLSDIHLEESESIIYRFNGFRQITVKANARGRDLGSFTKEVSEKIKTGVEIPENIKIGYGGQFENLRRARLQLIYISIFTIFLIYIALLIYFNNEYIYVIITLLSIPVSIAGGLFFLFVRNMSMSTSTAVGFIFLFGISIIPTALLVYHIKSNSESGEEIKDAIISASVIQFRRRTMLLLTALTGFIPTFFSSGIGIDIQKPMVTVISGGLISSILFTTFIVPFLHYILKKRNYFENREIL